MVDNAVRAGVTLSAPAEHAFSIFVDRITDWWPKAYTFSRDDLAQIAIDPRPGGRWYESICVADGSTGARCAPSSQTDAWC
jgi:uncharacterized protein YndB with AHSA1/START domain